jgi:recombination protein RecT
VAKAELVEGEDRALPTKAARVEKLRQALQARHASIAALIPRHLTPERLFAVAMTAMMRTPLLLECTTVSIMRAIATGAQLGLDVSGVGGMGYLVPFKNRRGFYEAQFIAGYQGLIDLARRGGAVISVRAKEVYDKDEVVYEEGAVPILRHKPYVGEDAGPLSAVYAVAHYINGFVQSEVMFKWQVEKVRNRSRAADKGPWATDEAMMWRKTAVRRLCKYLPQNPDLARAEMAEDRMEAGEPTEPLPGEEAPWSDDEQSGTAALKANLGLSASAETIAETEEETASAGRDPGEEG